MRETPFCEGVGHPERRSRSFNRLLELSENKLWQRRKLNTEPKKKKKRWWIDREDYRKTKAKRARRQRTNSRLLTCARGLPCRPTVGLYWWKSVWITHTLFSILTARSLPCCLRPSAVQGGSEARVCSLEAAPSQWECVCVCVWGGCAVPATWPWEGGCVEGMERWKEVSTPPRTTPSVHTHTHTHTHPQIQAHLFLSPCLKPNHLVTAGKHMETNCQPPPQQCVSSPPLRKLKHKVGVFVIFFWAAHSSTDTTGSSKRFSVRVAGKNRILRLTIW